MSCPIIVECCPGYVPKTRYYATFTNAGGACPACGCDCVTSIVVPIDLYATGDYTTNPNCPGCKTAEKWTEWRGDATHADCFDGATLRFCVRMVCDPAGAGTVCGSFAVYVEIECGSPPTACDYGGVGMTALGPPDSCTCSPFDLKYTTDFTLGSAGCCRDSAGDAIPGQWTLEITE